MKGFLHDFEEAPNKLVLPEVGRLAIGEQVQSNGNYSYPTSLDYFRVRGEPNVQAAFRKTYGEKPNELNVSFLSNDPSEVCRTELVLRVGTGKYAWGDGRTFNYYDSDEGEMKVAVVESAQDRDIFMEQILDEAKEFASSRGSAASTIKNAKWKTVLTMRVWLPDVAIPGVWQFTTSGANTSVKNISGVFKTVLLAAGTVQFLPFKLKVSMHKSDTVESRKYPVLTLTPPSTDVQRVVHKYGKKLFDTMFGGGEIGTDIYGISESSILATGKLLEASTNVEFNAAPPKEETPDPDPLTRNLAESHFNQPLIEEKGNNKPPVEGTLADRLQQLKKTGTWTLMKELWRANERFQYVPAFEKAFVIRAAALSPDTETLNSLVKTYKKYHTDEEFITAVKKRRASLK